MSFKFIMQWNCWNPLTLLTKQRCLFIVFREWNHIRNCLDVLTKICVNSTITQLIAFLVFFSKRKEILLNSCCVKSLEYDQCSFLTNTYTKLHTLKLFAFRNSDCANTCNVFSQFQISEKNIFPVYLHTTTYQVV